MRKFIYFFLLVATLGITGCNKNKAENVPSSKETETIEKEESKKDELNEEDSGKEESYKNEANVEGSGKEESDKNELNIDESKKEESKNDESNLDNSKKEESKKDESNVDNSKKEESKKDESNVDNSKKEESKKDESNQDDSKKEESKKDESNIDDSKKEESKNEQPKEEETKEEAKAPVGYDPQRVVSLVITKCEAGGMITTEHNLQNLLNEGKITKEEYDEYYPLDGLDNSYYSVFVNSDLNKASTSSNKLLGSEEAIADYIASMLLTESHSIFSIKHTGTYSMNGETFYEFRCYR